MLPGGVRRLFRLRVRRRADLDREIDEELASHLALRIEWLVARGMPRADAEQEARRRFGNFDDARQRLHATAAAREHRMRLREWLGSLRDDIQYALRQVRRAPGFATAVVVTLALGIGANAAMFATSDRLLLRPPAGVVHPDRVSRLYFTRTFSWAGTITGAFSSYGDYAALRDALRDIDGIAIYGTYQASMGRGPGAMQVRRTLATPSYFPLLGVRPELGRFFDSSEERIPLGEAVAVLSHGFWQRQFAGDRNVLGRTIQLGARQYRIIGVAAPNFSGVDLDATDVWVPFSAAASELGGDKWYVPGWWTGPTVLVRLRPDVDRRRIEAQATAAYRHTLEETERSHGTGVPRSSGGLAGASAGDSTARVELGSIIAGRAPPGAREPGPRVAMWLLAMAAIVLLIACGNVVNLLLARAATRQTEIAIRLALGAARARLARQLLVDTSVLVGLGGLAGLAIGILGAQVIRARWLTEGPATASLVDGRLLAFTFLVTLVAALVTGLSPSLAASRLQLTDSLKARARGGGYRRSRVRDAMVLVQAAFSVVLLIGAGLFVQSLRNVLAIDMGFDARHVSMATIDFSNDAFTPTDIDAYFHTAAERVRAIPGVEATALTTAIPFWSSYASTLVIPGRERLPITKDGGPYQAQVTPDYFRTVGTRIIRGRGLTAADGAGAARVAIVSETMARLVWPGESALGKCMKVGADTAPCSTVVGIAQDARRQTLEALPVMQYYLPLAQHQVRTGDVTLLVRTAGEPSTIAAHVRATMTAILPDLPYIDIRPLQSLIDPRIEPWRIGASIFVAFGLLAMLIASVGLYGVIAYEVTQRGHEFGVRAALGATRQDIVRHVLWRGVGLAVIGIVVGVAIARIGAPWVTPLLFETSATSPSVFTAVALVLLAVAVLACVLPARRAAASDPAAALRAE